jgi:DNA polymerase IIIc chi subunit
MVKAEFIASGSEVNFALKIACELTANIFLNEESYSNSKWIDIRCNSLQDAEILDELMWASPENILLPHKLIHNKDEDIHINIGYPGTIFSTEKNKSLINIAIDLPRNIDHYDYFYQLVIEDNSTLREGAAEAWNICKQKGLNPLFKKWQ